VCVRARVCTCVCVCAYAYAHASKDTCGARGAHQSFRGPPPSTCSARSSNISIKNLNTGLFCAVTSLAGMLVTARRSVVRSATRGAATTVVALPRPSRSGSEPTTTHDLTASQAAKRAGRARRAGTLDPTAVRICAAYAAAAARSGDADLRRESREKGDNNV
jgi:hypothetical protein